MASRTRRSRSTYVAKSNLSIRSRVLGYCSASRVKSSCFMLARAFKVSSKEMRSGIGNSWRIRHGASPWCMWKSRIPRYGAVYTTGRKRAQVSPCQEQRMRIAIFGIVLCTPFAAVADDWPQWLGPKRDGVWRETGILDKFPAGGPKVLWRAPCGMGYAGPAVSGGKVFLPDRVLPQGQTNPESPWGKTSVRGTDRLICLDESTGKEIWTFASDIEYRVSYPAGPRCTPTVDGDIVYWLGAMGDPYGIDIKNSKSIWERGFVKDVESWGAVWGFASHPLVDGDKLVCLVGGPEAPGVVAFDKKSGKEVWKALSIGGDPGYNAPVIFEVNGKPVLIIWHSHAVVGLEPESGKKLWQNAWEIQAAIIFHTQPVDTH